MADKKAHPRKFRLLVGKHSQKEDGVLVTYKPNDVFECTTDLVERFNTPSSRKFEYVEDDPRTSPGRVAYPHLEKEKGPERAERPAPAPSAPVAPKAPPFGGKNLDAMSPEQLKALAAEEEIDLRGATKKEDMLKILRANA